MTGGAALAAIGLTVVVWACATPPPTTTPSTPAGPPVDPAAVPFLEPFGHRAAGPSRRQPVEVGGLTEQPWSLYLEVSRAVGLDFSALGGRTGELVRTPIVADAPDAELIVLVVGGRAVGAWISPGGTSSGVLPIDSPG